MKLRAVATGITHKYMPYIYYGFVKKKLTMGLSFTLVRLIFVGFYI